jgi:hypothetical protein
MINTKYNSPNSRFKVIISMSNWTIFSNHGHVLFCLARDSEARLRDVATDVGITERAVQKIVRDLQDADMVSVKKIGRRNSYRIHKNTSLRHDLESACTLKDLIKVVNKSARSRSLMTADAGGSRHRAPAKPKTSKAKTGSQTSSGPKTAVSKPKPGNPGLKKTVPAKQKPAKSKTSESKERQQGMLF